VKASLWDVLVDLELGGLEESLPSTSRRASGAAVLAPLLALDAPYLGARVALADGEPGDFSVFVAARTSAWYVLAGRHPFSALPEDLTAQAGWQKAARTAEAWCGVHVGRALVRGAWIDVPGGGAGATTPLSRFSVDLTFPDEWDDWREAVRRSGMPAAGRVLDGLGVPLSPAVRHFVETCLLRAARAYRTVRLGMGFGGAAPSLDVLITDVRRHELRGDLEALRWPGRDSVLCDVLDALGEMPGATLALGLALREEELAPSLRVVLQPAGAADLGDLVAAEPWRAALDLLVERGLCTADVRAAVLGWPCAVQLFPDAFDFVSDGVPAARIVHHLEVDVAADGRLSAAAELGALRLSSGDAPGPSGEPESDDVFAADPD
jgi:hypothetical protein